MVASNRRTTHDGEGAAGNPHNEFAVVVTKDSHIADCIPLGKNKLTDHVVFHYIYTRGSVVCHITGRRRKWKGLEIPCKSIIIMHQQITWHLFETQCLLLL